MSHPLLRKTLFIILALSIGKNINAQENNFQHFEIDIHGKKHDFFEFIEHVEIIRLEETDKSLLSFTEYYFKTPNGIVIIEKDVGKPNKLILFNKNGDYINIIDRRGPGSEEYRNISDAWFLNNKIELYSSHSRSIQRYTLEGRYIETIPVGYEKGIIGGAMVPYENGYLFHQLDPSGPMTSVEYNELAFTDSLVNITKWAGHTSSPNPAPLNIGGHFSSFDGALFFKKSLNDTVYEVLNRDIYPRFKFDFGDKWAWSDPQSTESLKQAMFTITKSGQIFEVLPSIGKHYIMLTYYYDTKAEPKGLINRDNGVFVELDMRKKNKEYYKIKFLNWEEDRLVCSLAAYDFDEFLENLDDDQYSIAGGLKYEDFSLSENPVLLRIKFRIPD